MNRNFTFLFVKKKHLPASINTSIHENFLPEAAGGCKKEYLLIPSIYILFWHP